MEKPTHEQSRGLLLSAHWIELFSTWLACLG